MNYYNGNIAYHAVLVILQYFTDITQYFDFMYRT